MAKLAQCVCVLVLLLWTLCGVQSSSLYSYEIHIDPGTVTSMPSCPPLQNVSVFPNLTSALSCRMNSTKYVLNAGFEHYDLYNGTENVFVSVCDVALVSSSASEAVLVHCMPGAGLAFEGSSNILISNVRFLNCGALRNSSSMNFSTPNETFSLLQFNVSLYFYQCVSVTLDRVAVVNSSSATGVVMYDTIGTNNILHSTFSGNGYRIKNDTVDRGGGFLVGFTYCKPGEQHCVVDDSTQSHMNSDSSYFFQSCVFKENYCKAQKAPVNVGAFVYPSRIYHSSFGTGGGLAIFFKSNATNNAVVIEDCNFTDNQAIHGSGLHLSFEDLAIDNTVDVSGCSFTGNCPIHKHDNRGGGVRATFYAHKTPTEFPRNKVTIDDCTLWNNSAFHGGGMSLSFALQDVKRTDQLTNVSIQNTVFDGNKATIGSALEITLLPMYAYGHLGKMFLTNCNFTKNTGWINNKSRGYFSHSLGAVFINEVFVFIDGYANFESNTDSAVVVSGAEVSFQACDAHFFNNSGANGGAIALLGAAYLLVDNYSVMSFTGNTARQYGGAIYNNYIVRTDMRYYLKCFIRYISNNFDDPNDWEAQFIFQNNSAASQGNSIYSSSLYPCSWTFDASMHPEKIFCWNDKWDYSDKNCSEEIYSGPSTFKNTSKDFTYHIFPGQLFQIAVEAYDELHHNITNQTVYSASISKDNALAEVEPEFGYTAARYLRVSGTGDQNVSLELDTAGEQDWHVELQLEIMSCPPGMITNGTEDKTVCTCPAEWTETYNQLIRCDKFQYEVRIKRNHWMGSIDNGSDVELEPNELFVASCPYFYCMDSKNPDYLKLPPTVNNLSREICKKQNREGVLCGQCVSDHAVAINDYEYTCVPCDKTVHVRRNIAVYIITAYVPILIFLLVIIFFNIRLTSGPLNAFILFAQLINSVNMFDLPVTLNKYADIHVAYTFIYGIFNLNFFSYLLKPSCVNKHFNTLDVLSLDYCIAAFPLAMIVLITTAIRLKDKFSCRKPGAFEDNRFLRAFVIKDKALLHSLVAFYLLSYTKFSQASLLIISTFRLVARDGKLVEGQRVYLAGQYAVMDGDYMYRYGLPSYLIFVLFVCLPPLLLLGPLNWFNNRATKYRCLRRVWPQDKVHIILDTFQGCFRPKMRLYSGVYFLFRLMVFITYAYSNDILQRYVIQQILVCSVLMLLAVLQPYQRKTLNRIDTFIFFILAVINALSLHAVAQFNASDEKYQTPDSIIITQFFFIFLPLLGVPVYLYFSWNTHCYQLLRNKVFRFLNYCYSSDSDSDEEERPLLVGSYGDTAVNDDSILQILERANEPNTFCRRVRPASISLQQSGSECTTATSEASGKAALVDYGSRDTTSGIGSSQAHSNQTLSLN